MHGSFLLKYKLLNPKTRHIHDEDQNDMLIIIMININLSISSTYPGQLETKVQHLFFKAIIVAEG